MARPGVMCLEGEWTRDLTDHSSVRPSLELLERLEVIDFAHRDVATVPELTEYLNRWTLKKHQRYGVLYLAVQGSPGPVMIGDSRLSLDDLAVPLERRCRGRVIYFGRCSSIDLEDQTLDAFLRRTRARAVCGYSTEVDWGESAAFDLLLLGSLARYKRIDAPFRYLDRQHGQFVKRLRFKAIWR